MKVQPQYWSLPLWICTFFMHNTAMAAVPATGFVAIANSTGFESENLIDQAAPGKTGSSSSSNSTIDRHTWPPMKHHDIWNDVDTNAKKTELNGAAAEMDLNDLNDAVVVSNFDKDDFDYVANSFGEEKTESNRRNESFNVNTTPSNRHSKVLHIFPVPVDGECPSDDGRRTGTCFNAYECRQKGGRAKGECAMGFGVCCVFIANCNTTISNNVTYLVSPQFPSFMPNNFSSCSLKIKLMNEDISQLRFDFNHFSLGQPNRRTGVCDGDVFNVSGGPGGIFSLCGQNSGQHIYYDVGGRMLPRQTLYGNLRPPTLAQIYPNLNTSGAQEQLIEINMKFAQRFLPIRIWEIRIAQIPFSQRAPAGCLQYHFGTEGIIQTFNFADNGRHLANQHYRVCMRQESEMCSIMYQPCDEQSFRIGPSMPVRDMDGQPLNGGSSDQNGGSISNDDVGGGAGMVGMGGAAPAQTGTMGIMNMNGGVGGGMLMMPMGVMPSTMMPAMPAMVAADDVATSAPLQMTSMAAAAAMATASTSQAATMASLTPSSTAAASAASATMPSSAASSASPATMTTAAITQRTTQMTAPSADETATASASSSTGQPTRSSTAATTPLSDDVEGSGGGDGGAQPPISPSRRPRPVSGGFDLLGFLRSAFDINLLRKRNSRAQRHQRQIYSTCSDRITLPCIIEDFIGTGLGPLPSCEPVHCGNRFCASGVWPCRIESTVTPFFMNIHFGDGAGKGSAEENIGACIRYTQVQCM